MTFAIIAQIWRKPGTTLEEFINHYENSHIPLLHELGGSTFPIKHERHYIRRTKQGGGSGGGPSNPNTPATLIRGNQEDIDYDCVAEAVFEDRAAFEKFITVARSGEGAARIVEDEAKFIDQSKLTIVEQAGESRVSVRK